MVEAAAYATDTGSDIRYGVFLRPDPATCWNITQVTFALERQFGLVSAGNFAPHATLIGNLCITGGPDMLIGSLDKVFAGQTTFPVFNAGLVRKLGYQYNINLDETGSSINEPLNRIARDVKDAVLPLSVAVQDHRVVPVADYEFAGHLGLASHELIVDDRMSDEVGEYLQGLPISPPPRKFTAEWYTLYELRSNWSSSWWENMRWRHVKSWHTTT